MPIPPEFMSLFSHTAPGLVFDEHRAAGQPRRARSTPHQLGGRPSWWSRRVVRRLASHPALSDFAEFYTAHDGADLCIMPDPFNGGQTAALSLLPVREWEPATAQFTRRHALRRWQAEEVPLYRSAPWRVFALSPDEGFCLTIFFGGEHEGVPLAGKIYHLALDGPLAADEPVAPTFHDLLRQLGTDLGGFLDRIGFTSSVQGPGGGWYGDPPIGYLEDVTKDPDYTPW